MPLSCISFKGEITFIELNVPGEKGNFDIEDAVRYLVGPKEVPL